MDLQVATIAQLSPHLRALRKARKLTQADLGRLLGVKQSRIADIEGDPGSVSVSQLHKMLSALGAQMLLRESDGGGWVPTGKGPATQPLARIRAAKKSTGSW
jgi:HTH-type transcriptional regulator/antitoxin HipB